MPPTRPGPALLAEVVRGDVVEGRVLGHLAVVGRDGELRVGVGDPGALTTLRSSAKPFQGASFVASGAVERLGLDEESVAIACASHQGEPGHLEAVRRILHAAGLHEDQLRCGVHAPADPEAAAELIRRGAAPTAIHNNCSGKHSAMLAGCAVRGWPTESYLSPEHPLQREIRSRIAHHAGRDPESLPAGTDGCGLPTLGLPLQEFARSLARAGAQDPAVGRCLAAMAAHPWLVGGSSSFDTKAMLRAEGRITAKGGAAAVFATVHREQGWALALKLEAGSPQWLPQVAAEALSQLGALSVPAASEVAPREMRNWAGTLVGELRTTFRV